MRALKALAELRLAFAAKAPKSRLLWASGRLKGLPYEPNHCRVRPKALKMQAGL